MKKLLLIALLLYSCITFAQKDTFRVTFIYSDTGCKVVSLNTKDVFSDPCLFRMPGYVVFWRSMEEYFNISWQPIMKRYKIWHYEIRF